MTLTLNRGLLKLAEECGELTQAAVKMAAFPANDHPAGWDGPKHLEDEIADVIAAIRFVVEKYDLNSEYIDARSDDKLINFRNWLVENEQTINT